MLLVVDVGNTNITLGVFDDKNIIATFRLTTKQPRTSDEYGMVICELLQYKGVERTAITGVAIASVVPNVMHSLTSGIIKYLNLTPLIVGPGTKTGMRILRENAREIGADRIVDAVAAYELYGGPVIVIDYGTATTYDLVLADGSFAAGVTAPGIRISAQALWNEAARLPEIEIKRPETILGKDTITSMQAGLFFGQVGQTEYIVNQMKEESGLDDIRVVATGGLGNIIAAETDSIEYYNPDLTLQGLRIIYEKCAGKTK